MRKIKMVEEAVARITAVIIIVIVIVAGIGILVYTAIGTGYWETEAEFGSWTEEITLYYADGTSQSLKLILDGKTSWNPFKVTYEGKEIRRVKYSISAIATGTGYTGADIDINNLYMSYRIRYGTQIKEQHEKKYSGTVSCPLNTKTEIANRVLWVTSWEDNPPSMYPDGEYIIEFVPSGSVVYKGTPGGTTWQSASLPSGKYITITLTRNPSMEITVKLSDDISAYY